MPASSPEGESQQPPGAGDTDRWVEEQFDLARYEEPDGVKETDILSDDDEFCEAARGAEVDTDLPDRLQAASLGQGRGRTAQLRKQEALSAVDTGPESTAEDVIWVRREDFGPARKLNTEI